MQRRRLELFIPYVLILHQNYSILFSKVSRDFAFDIKPRKKGSDVQKLSLQHLQVYNEKYLIFVSFAYVPFKFKCLPNVRKYCFVVGIGGREMSVKKS